MLALAPVHAFAQSPEDAPAPQALPPLPDLSTVTDVDALTLAAREAIAAKDWPRHRALMARLVELRPHNGYFALEHAASFALEGDKSGAYDALLKLHATGWGSGSPRTRGSRKCGAPRHGTTSSASSRRT